MIHSGIEGWWQTSLRLSPPRPLSLVTMSVTLMAASCDSIGTCSLDVDAESLADSLADSAQVDTSHNHRTAGSKGVMFSVEFFLLSFFISRYTTKCFMTCCFLITCIRDLCVQQMVYFSYTLLSFLFIS